MLELPTTSVAELFQAGPDVVDDPAVQELREEIVQRCVKMQSHLPQRLEEKRRSLEMRLVATSGAASLAQADPDALF